MGANFDTAIMNKQELLSLAKFLNITGRHSMSRDELAEAINKVDDSKIYTPERVVHTKRKVPSSANRDEDGKVIRAGKNLSGNVPFKRKFYYLDPRVVDGDDWTPEYKAAILAAPTQVQLILRFMAKYSITDADTAEQGGEIVRLAIEASMLSTKIKPPALFAYYRRVLETLGVKQA